MYRKILAPLDGSEFSEHSLEHVKAVAKGCRAKEVVLLRVIEPLPQTEDIGGVTTEDWYRDAQAKARAETEKYVSQVADKLKKEGIAAKGIVVLGRAADEILDYVTKNQMDLIIMGTHGRSGVSRWVIGSVADKIIRHSPVPVLVASPAALRVD